MMGSSPVNKKGVAMNDRTRAILAQASTASLATLLFKQGLRNQFIQGVARLGPPRRQLVGPVYTLRYIPAREDLNGIEVFQNPEHPQRQAVETIPSRYVLVMDCRQDSSAASAGAILATRLSVRGCAGIVTDGGLRDVDEIAALDMPAYCAGPCAPTNLTKHQALDLNVPIGCGGVAVFPGDIAVGDGDGVMIIPAAIADEVANDVAEMERFEAYVLEEVRNGASIIGLYPPSEEQRERYRNRETN